jgi:hypothetical protein
MITTSATSQNWKKKDGIPSCFMNPKFRFPEKEPITVFFKGASNKS